MATLVLAPAEDADLEHFSNLALDAITDPEQGNPGGEYIKYTWPDNDTLSGRKQALSRFQHLKSILPPRSFMKVTDSALGDEVVGGAIWREYAEPPQALPMPDADFWSCPEDKRYAQHLTSENNKIRLRRYASIKGPVITLQNMCVAPAHQRRGIGSMLVAEGVERARRLGASMTVDSSMQGLRCYEKHGFRVQETCTLPLPVEWHGRPRCTIISMSREKEEPELL